MGDWKLPIPGFPSYRADRAGRIWKHGTVERQAFILGQALNSEGYPSVRVRVESRRIHVAVHKLVALAFHGVPEHGQQVRHLDGDKLNSSPNNLKWGTCQENIDDRGRHGRSVHGERVNTAKLTTDQVREIRCRSDAGETFYALAKVFPVSANMIARIARRMAWRHVA